MTKLIYAIKIHLFRDEGSFKTTQKEKSQLERFVSFGVLVYVKYCFEANMATNAAWSDLSLWKDRTNHAIFDPQVSDVVKNAVKSHLWYLSDELVGLSLFSERVSNEGKVAIVMQMEIGPTDRNIRGDSSLLTDQAVLDDFSNKRSLQLFDKLKFFDNTSK